MLSRLPWALLGALLPASAANERQTLHLPPLRVRLHPADCSLAWLQAVFVLSPMRKFHHRYPASLLSAGAQPQ